MLVINFKMDSFFKFSMRILVICACFMESQAGMEIKSTLRIASSLKPMLLMKMTENGRFDRYRGFVKDYSEELVNILGFQYELVLPQDFPHQGPSGRVNSSISGYWNGVFGMLIRNEVDMAFGDTEVTMERAQVVDFSAPVLTTRFAVLHKRQNTSYSYESDQSHWTVLAPFPAAVWIPFLILTVIYLGFIKLHGLRSSFSKFFPDSELRYSKKLAKMFLIAWALLLFTSYISNYTALKVLKSIHGDLTMPQSLVDVASDKEVKIGWVTRGPVDRFFRNTVNELYQKIYMQNIGRDWVSSQSEGVSKVINENGNFAFILDSLSADFETQLDCSLYKLPQEFGPIRPIAIATPIGSPLRERINQAVLSLSEQGITEALQKRWFANTNIQCSTTSENRANVEKENASVQEMSLVFILAVIGLFLSTIAGLLEIQFLKRKSKSATLSTLPMKAKPPRQQQQQQSELLPKFNLEDV